MKNYFKHKLRGKNPIAVVGWVLFFTILFLGFIALVGYIFQLLWNGLMPDIFGLTTITYWQAVGLMLIAKLLFGGIGKGERKDKCCKDHSSKSWKKSNKKDFSKWDLYEEFWSEEGEQLYSDYVNKKTNTNTSELTNDV